ncbi:MAG: hypothetical protein RBS01_02960 [Candidatus Dojkabacteria bacterium]|jgi:hypothetical protein|nr:hypothetical protein [Candidatus Dojkabacteria bacterium]
MKSLLKYNSILLLPVIILILSVYPVFAQASLSIGVAPTSKVLKMLPGETYSDEIVFWNLSQDSDTYKVFISSFQQIENQPGTAIILTEEEDALAPYSASKWITVSKSSLILEPNKNTRLQYSITVPSDATNGEFNAEIFLISENDYNLQGTATFTNLAAGMPILIQIGDDYVQNAELLRFVAEKKVYEKINVDFLTTIKNLGDTHITPTGEILIENIFRQEVARIPFNKNAQSLLRDNLGNYVDNWTQSGYISPNKAIAVGPMKARLMVTYRSFQPGFAVLASETSFWIIPWKIIIAILIATLLVIIIRITKKKINRKNEIS